MAMDMAGVNAELLPQSPKDAALVPEIRKAAGKAAAAAAAASSTNQPLHDDISKAEPILPHWMPRTPPVSPKLQRQDSSGSYSIVTHVSSPSSVPLASSSSSSSTASSPRHANHQQHGQQVLQEQQAAGALQLTSSAFAGKRVLIISGGTRGDVQPATALGVSIAGLGARVLLAADRSFGGFVTGHGLEYFALGGDAREMMALTVKWGGMLPTEMSGMFWLRQQIKEMLDSVWEVASAYKPDLIIANQLAYGQVHVAEKLQTPLHIILTIPWLPTTSFAHPWARAYGENVTYYFNSAAKAILRPVLGLVKWSSPKRGAKLEHDVLSRVCAASNWITTPLLDHTAWWGIVDLIMAHRHKLGLPLLSADDLGFALYRLPTTCLFSSHLVPRPPDWKPHVTLSGFISLPDAVSKYGTASSSNNSTAAALDSSSVERQQPDDSTSTVSSNSNSSSGEQSYASDVCFSSRDYASQQQQQQQQRRQPPVTPPALWKPPRQLLDFLEAGSPPMYVGFGSMVVEDAQKLIEMIVAAAGQLPGQQRLLICTGWSELGSGICNTSNTVNGADGVLNSNSSTTGNSISSSSSSDGNGRQQPQVLCLSEVPHEWLFPRCSVLVHHGGVGTTAAGLKSGKPTLVIAAFGDLFFWGDMCHQLHVGPATIPLERLDFVTLSEALQDVCTNDKYKQNAEAVAVALQQEDGLSAALQSIEQAFLHRQKKA